jgi:hypothetical protein
MLTVLAILLIWFGVYPTLLLHVIRTFAPTVPSGFFWPARFTVTIRTDSRPIRKDGVMLTPAHLSSLRL